MQRPDDVPGEPTEKVSDWLICNALSMNEKMKDLGVSHDARNLKLIPWVGVAAQLGLPTALRGEFFAFLPLSLVTGLPVHVNGYFELSPDRGRLWQHSGTGGLQGEALAKADWNENLLSFGVGLCYEKLLVEVRPPPPPPSMLNPARARHSVLAAGAQAHRRCAWAGSRLLPPVAAPAGGHLQGAGGDGVRAGLSPASATKRVRGR